MSGNLFLSFFRFLLKSALLFVIRAYQALLSPLFYGSCRFEPSCSHYAAEAVEIHGPVKGAWLALGRLLRCQPFCRGGFDPVPEKKFQGSPNKKFSSHAGNPAL